jgi:hypothetical protein
MEATIKASKKQIEAKIKTGLKEMKASHEKTRLHKSQACAYHPMGPSFQIST